jgi:putative transposase
MEKEDTKINNIRAYKIKLQLNKTQRDILEQWNGCSRYTYNKVIACYKNEKNTFKNEFKLRNRFVFKTTNSKRKELSVKEKIKKEEKKKQPKKKKKKTKKKQRRRTKKLSSINNFFNNKEWLEKCPCDIRKNAIKEAINAYKVAFTNLKRGNIKHFNINFKSKKKEIKNGWSMKFCKEHVKKLNNCKLSIYPSLLSTIKVCNKRQLNKFLQDEIPEKDCELIKNKFGDYFLILKKEIVIKPTVSEQKVVSIDPGIRKYITTYSPDQKESLLIGANYEPKVYSLLKELDLLYSLETHYTGKYLKQIKNKILQKRKKIFALKKEIKNQVSNLITKKYDIILMPKLDVLAMTNRYNRHLKNKSVRSLLSMCHCELFNEIKRKSFERGKIFLEVFEHYTSQTCPNCGHAFKSSSEVKRCTKCSFVFDRDVVGALNILLKAVRVD